jgi:exosortase A-associated hydrolase 2
VHAPAFAEEMNRSRRMVAQQSRMLASAGFAVLRPDLTGCGDSEGEFREASWSVWLDDLQFVIDWTKRQPGAVEAPTWLWGHRAGALLACEAAARHPDCRLLFWQPATSGRSLLRQFLRLGSAGLRAAGKQGTTLEQMLSQLRDGRDVDVAGYRVSAALAAGLDAAHLAPPPRPVSVAWLEVSRQAGDEPSPAMASAAKAWGELGHHVRFTKVRGPAFWETAEIEDAPDLLAATLRSCTSCATGLETT